MCAPGGLGLMPPGPPETVNYVRVHQPSWCICIYPIDRFRGFMVDMADAVVIDEWALVRQGIARLLATAGVTDVRLAATATEGLAALNDGGAKVLVIGYCADAATLDVVRRAAAADPALRVVALIGPMNQRQLVELCSAGASAILLRSSGESELLDALAHTDRGDRYLAPDLLPTLFSDRHHFPRPRSHRVQLTARERSVLNELVAGRTNREIADTLCIGAETVKTHLGNIYAKLDVSRRDEAIGMALTSGLL
jgi:DNA-binding NarL/FixJ family response regulator